MTNNKYSDIIAKLIDATRENKCTWSRTSRQDEFSVEVGDYTITITKSQTSLFSLGSSHNETYGIGLYNVDDTQIDFQEVSSDCQDYDNVVVLFVEAQRCFYHVDDVLQEIIKKLQG